MQETQNLKIVDDNCINSLILINKRLINWKRIQDQNPRPRCFNKHEKNRIIYNYNLVGKSNSQRKAERERYIYCSLNN